jgi:cystathionine beta-lyase/cystathionine gamma-synthase
MENSDWMSQRAARIQGRDLDNYSEKTHLVHGRFGAAHWDYKHHIVPPASASVSYRLNTSQRGARGFEDFGHDHLGDGEHILIYDRLDEPTRAMLEENLAYAERGECAVAFASGMAAISAALCTSAAVGTHVLTHEVLYGCTFSLLRNWLPRFGIESSTADFTDPARALEKVRPNTTVVYFETPVNPDLKLIDIQAVAERVREINGRRSEEQKIRLIVDNTFATPYAQRPLTLGADIVVASLTKNIGGFGTDLGGVVVGPAALERAWLGFRKDFGGVLSSRSAWPILVYGLPTLAVRIRQQQQTALKLARFLQRHPCVTSVSYPGLESFAQKELAQRQMVDYDGHFAPGTLIYFTLREASGKAGFNGQRFIDYLAENSYAITMAVSLGQVRTLIEHPFSMTHSALAADPSARSHVDPAGIRLSVGLEKGDDLIHDLSEALEHVFQPT